MGRQSDTDEHWSQLVEHYLNELREPTAYHEAGHAVIGIFTGDVEEVRMIDLVPHRERGDWGFTRTRKLAPQLLDHSKDRMARAVQMCGGYVAQWKFEPIEDHHEELELDEQMHGAKPGDFADAYDLFSDYGSVEYPAQAVRQALGHARSLVENPALWGAIQHIAEHLLSMPPDKAIVEGKAAHDLMDEVHSDILDARNQIDILP